MNCKIYITDEGFGPIVRQSAIIEEFKNINDDINVTLQTQRQLSAAKRIIKDIAFEEKFNNITWSKTDEGSPDLTAIHRDFSDYGNISEAFIKTELENFDYDFLITDFVYEAFEVARRKKIPAFGVSHFTWDWFFSKLYPTPVSDDVLNRFLAYAGQAEVLYFPPFTPKEILNHYKKKAVEVPLIVRKHVSQLKSANDNKFRVLIMDSGAGVLGKQIQKALAKVSDLKDFQFYISSAFDFDAENIRAINKNSLFMDYIPHMDLVIGRAGFNTISECIAYRTPMLLINEAMNPEMNENIINIKHEGLGSFISINQFTDKLDKFLPKFITHEYRIIYENMKTHEIRTDGAKVVAEDIMNRVG
ncbi:MAG: hypothetical protein COA57_01510 [Flavobacteriales bacterium]|nr:MAG: hypothetical protein COA57_01510 [Flavobacteriales bacterium]